MTRTGPKYYLKKTVNGRTLYLCRILTGGHRFTWRLDMERLRIYNSFSAAALSVENKYRDAEIVQLTDEDRAQIPPRHDPWVLDDQSSKNSPTI